MARRFLVPLVLSITIACGTTDENPVSEQADPLVDFPGLEPPVVLMGWPCPPFQETDSTEDRMDDDDLDGIVDCQEDIIGSNSDSADSDNDGVSDIDELGRLVRQDDDQADADILDEVLDTDRDGIIDMLDDDDDNDTIPTIMEDAVPAGDGDGSPLNDDFDADGTPNYLDDDDDDDLALVATEDLVGSGAACGGATTANDGNPMNDDFDCDGFPNWIDSDDDGDGAIGCEDSIPDGIIQFDPNPDDGVFQSDDVDGDGALDPYDPDDDGDGVLTIDEDFNGNGNPCDDDLDEDGRADFIDLDEDGDDILTLDEDLNGNGLVTDDDSDGDGLANYRDLDDDNDGVETEDELGLPNGDGDLPDQPVGVDTDGDGIDDYLDIDDDNDGCPTILEDANQDGDPRNDTDDDGNPFYLLAGVSDCLEDRFDTVLTGTGFDANDGARVYARLSDTAAKPTALDGGESVIVAGGFTIRFPLTVVSGSTYVIDYYVDVVADGVCLDADDANYQLSGLVAPAATLEVDTTAGVDVTGVCVL
ncbi:MAG: hypothetical protein AAGA48_13230 [Myxococcota bacterium]